MVALFPTPTPGIRLRCDVCGCEDVEIDVVDGSSRADGVAFSLELGECTRCAHRWTRPVRAAASFGAQKAAAVGGPREPVEAFPNAA